MYPFLAGATEVVVALMEGSSELLLHVGELRLCTPSGFLCGMCEQLDVFDTRVTAKKL